MRIDRIAVVALVLLPVVERVRGSEPGDDARPNLVLLLADDMGYADPSCFGGKAVSTPNDILPTFCAAAGLEVPTEVQVDGLNLLPILTGERTTLSRGTVFWQLDLYRHLQRHYPKQKPFATEVARRGRWKLLALDGEPVELFDVASDPTETRNLLAKEPEVAAELESELREFLAAPRNRSGKRPLKNRAAS